MKRLLAIAFLSLLSAWKIGVFAQNTHALASSYTIEIDSRSFVRVMGRTNVNTFECSYCSDLAYKVFTIGVNDNPQGDICFDDAIIQLKTGCFDCGLKEMTKDFRSLLKEPEHPYITMDIMCLKSDLHHSEVKFTIAGISNFYTIPFEVKQEGDKVHCIGKKAIDIQDFNIEPPTKLFGLVKVHEIIEVEFNLIVKIDANATTQVQVNGVAK